MKIKNINFALKKSFTLLEGSEKEVAEWIERNHAAGKIKVVEHFDALLGGSFMKIEPVGGNAIANIFIEDGDDRDISTHNFLFKNWGWKLCN